MQLARKSQWCVKGMPQQLREPVTITEDIWCTPSTWCFITFCNSVPGNLLSSSGFYGHYMQVMLMHKYWQNAHIHKIYIFLQREIPEKQGWKWGNEIMNPRSLLRAGFLGHFVVFGFGLQCLVNNKVGCPFPITADIIMCP